MTRRARKKERESRDVDKLKGALSVFNGSSFAESPNLRAMAARVSYDRQARLIRNFIATDSPVLAEIILKNMRASKHLARYTLEELQAAPSPTMARWCKAAKVTIRILAEGAFTETRAPTPHEVSLDYSGPVI